MEEKAKARLIKATSLSNVSNTTDALSIVKGHAKALAGEIKISLPSTKDTSTKLHLLDVLDRLNDALNPAS